MTIGFRGTEEYRRRLQQAAFDRGLKVQGLIEEAVNNYVFAVPESPDELTPKEMAIARKFIAWMKRSKESSSPTDRKLVDFILKEMNS